MFLIVNEAVTYKAKLVQTSSHSSSYRHNDPEALFDLRANPAISERCLDRNFEITSRLFGLVGENALDPDFRPSWRTVYPASMNLFAIVQLLYLLWSARSNTLDFLVILPNLLFAAQGVQIFIQCTRRTDEILALRSKLTEILHILKETRGNCLVIFRVDPRSAEPDREAASTAERVRGHAGEAVQLDVPEQGRAHLSRDHQCDRRDFEVERSHGVHILRPSIRKADPIVTVKVGSCDSWMSFK